MFVHSLKTGKPSICKIAIAGRHAWGGGGRYSTQNWVLTVKLIEKVVAVNLHTDRRSGHIPIPHHNIIEVVYKRWCI